MNWLYDNKYMVALLIILLIADRIWYLYKERCPRCKKTGVTKRLAENALGNVSSKVRVVRKCKKCNYVWTNIEDDPKADTPG